MGWLNDARYVKLSTQYETEQAQICKFANALEKEIEDKTGQAAGVGRFLELAKRYFDPQELDATTVNEPIEKIRIPLSKPELPSDTEEPA